MHKTGDIKIENLAKIEGHADLTIRIRNDEVQDVKLKVVENKRFFTRAVRGKSFDAVPLLVERICGVCSLAHLNGCTEAIEKALGVQPSEQTLLVRKLAAYGAMIRDHAAHLYLFCMPDLYGKDSVLELNKNLISECFEVKEAGNALTTALLGRAIHPAFSRIGGLAVLPKEDNLHEALHKLEHSREHVVDLCQAFYDCDWSFSKKSDFASLVTPDFSFLEGQIVDSNGLVLREEDYYDHLHRVVVPYSQSAAFDLEGKEYMVGALARINNNAGALHKETRRDATEFLKPFPSENVFHNNLAQAIEVLHCIDHATELLQTLEMKKEPEPKITVRACKGAGAIEAPRGILWYGVSIDKAGLLENATIVIPTAQNLVKLENDIRAYAQHLVSESKSKQFITREIEKLIRAYDPCMSCATHFLKVKWL